MSYTDRLHYSIYRAASDEFPLMAENLMRQVAVDGHVLRLVIFGSPEDNEQYMERRSFFRGLVQKYFKDCLPVLSYVAQPSLGDGLVMEVHYCEKSEKDEVKYKSFAGFPYVVVENDEGRFIYAGGLYSDLVYDIDTQSSEIFAAAGGILQEEGLEAGDIVRQWNYIERITDWDGPRQHYQMFNNARSSFYACSDWENGYPAATGIGTDLGGVLIDFDAVKFHSPSCSITPIDNRLQIAAHAYSENVLKEAGVVKTTPKFERAKSLDSCDGRMIYISGTAAIRGEDSLTGVGVERQYEITMENIRELVSDADLEILRVYLKHIEDYDVIRRRIECDCPESLVSFMRSDVCRSELLIEIEGIARQKR